MDVRHETGSVFRCDSSERHFVRLSARTDSRAARVPYSTFLSGRGTAREPFSGSTDLRHTAAFVCSRKTSRLLGEGEGNTPRTALTIRAHGLEVSWKSIYSVVAVKESATRGCLRPILARAVA